MGSRLDQNDAEWIQVQVRHYHGLSVTPYSETERSYIRRIEQKSGRLEKDRLYQLFHAMLHILFNCILLSQFKTSA